MELDFATMRTRLIDLKGRVDEAGWPATREEADKEADEVLEIAVNMMMLAELLQTLFDQAKRSLEIHDGLLASAKAEQGEAVSAERKRIIGLIEEWASHFKFNDEIMAGDDLERMIAQLSDPDEISFQQMIEDRERKQNAQP